MADGVEPRGNVLRTSQFAVECIEKWWRSEGQKRFPGRKHLLGYIVFPHPDVDSPHRIRGQKRIGRISFAGADASGAPWTQGAFREAHRAVHELLAL